jgi:hypothetical protein
LARYVAVIKTSMEGLFQNLQHLLTNVHSVRLRLSWELVGSYLAMKNLLPISAKTCEIRVFGTNRSLAIVRDEICGFLFKSPKTAAEESSRGAFPACRRLRRMFVRSESERPTYPL